MNTAAIMYMEQQNARMKQWERNQNILHRALFQRAANSHFIEVHGSNIIVLDLPNALHTFKHHPDLLTPLLSNALNREDKDMLEMALSEIYRKVMQG